MPIRFGQNMTWGMSEPFRLSCQFRFLRTDRLGAGAFARVYKCIERETGLEYAVKIIDKSKIQRSHMDEQAVVREILILQRLAEFRHVSPFPY